MPDAPHKAPPFDLFFEALFLERYGRLSRKEQKAVDKAVKLLSADPKHPSLHVHKARNVKAKYPTEGGNAVFIAYVTEGLGLTFEYGPSPGTIAFRNCGRHDPTERRI
jgi:hypothetical protein